MQAGLFSGEAMETIVITDDTGRGPYMIQRTLKRAGYSIEGAESVEAALPVIDRKRVDLIVLRLPGPADGVE